LKHGDFRLAKRQVKHENAVAYILRGDGCVVMSTWDFVQNIFLALGGVGLFLFGLKMMSDGLKSIAGNRMRTVIGKATANRFSGFLVGMAVTAIIQSSTATSVMAIGFVNAGLMKLNQFASVIIGAAVGTTSTAFLFSFRIDPFAPLFIFIGISLHIFFKKKKIRNIGFIILGLGILFFGLSTMGTPLREFSQLDGFQRMLVAFENPLLALLTGFVFTAVIQSSTATIGIIIAMYMGGVHLDFETAVFLVLGANVGTCSTALISSLAADRESKRAALVLTVYKVITCGIFGLLILVFPGIINRFQSTWHEGATQIAMFHAIYNISAAVMIFFTHQLVAMVYIILPKKTEEDNAKQLLYLSENNEQTPETTFAQAHSEMLRMGKMAFDNLKLALEAFFEDNTEKAALVIDAEETIDYLRNEISAYLMRIQSAELTTANVEQLAAMLQVVTDIERLGDHAENIAEYVVGEENHVVSITGKAMNELAALSKAMMDTLALTLEIFEKHDNSRLLEVEALEQNVDDLCGQFLENHIICLRNEECDPRSSVIFTNLVGDLERCSDHAVNIAEKIWSPLPNIKKNNFLM